MKKRRLMTGLFLGALLISTVLSPLGTAYAFMSSQAPSSPPTVDAPSVSDTDISAQSMMEDAGWEGISVEEMQADFDGTVNTQSYAADNGISSLQVQDQQADSGHYLYLSDLPYDPASWGRSSFQINTAVNGSTIRLKVDGEVAMFPKGVGAHANSELIYDISSYSHQYTVLSCYLGVDYSQNGKGNGVKFTISASHDKTDWTVLEQTGAVLPSDNAVYVSLDVSGYQYIKLYANDNGADGNDHSVYGDLRLLETGYDISDGLYPGLLTVAEYDAILSVKDVEENFTSNKKLVLAREFVNRVGYQNIQSAIRAQANVTDALDWLLSDTDALQLFIEAGSLFNGSGYRSMIALGNLYEAAKGYIGDEGDAYVYKKMMIATAVAYCKDIRTYMTTYGGAYISSDPVVKFTRFKELYDTGKFVRKEEFQTYSMELVRYVMDAKIDDSEILWLREYSESKYSDLNQRLNGYSFVRYVNIGYGMSQFYDPDYQDQWDAKYDFLRYGVSYGTKNLYRLWMMMENGGICWGISGMGMLLNEVHGIPSVNTYQPGHEAYLVYTQDEAGNGIWTIWNNISGWGGSYTRWGANTDSEARLLLGWGCMEYNTFNKNNTSYILLAQAALNQYDRYLDSMFYSLIANSYPAGSAQREQALNRSLECLDINLDAMYGLVKSYQADPSTTDQEWAALAKEIIQAYTYYPVVMVDLLDLILPAMGESPLKVEVATLMTQALHRASQATSADSLQPNACREIANSLLGSKSMELATFSFDGENANCIVLNESYNQYELMVRYSLDGGSSWETHMVNGQEVPYTPDHVIQLTQEQLARITAQQDIVVGLVGVDTTYTIDIKNGNAVQTSSVYQNDQEDLFIGATQHLEYSTDGGQTWHDYQSGLDSDTRFPGDVTVLLRYKAYGTYLQGPESEFTFHASQDTPEISYLQLQYVTLHSYSSQNSTSADHAAANFIDGSGHTAWHTKFGVVDTGKYYTVQFDRVRYPSKLSYLPGGGANGRLKSGQVYVSLDGEQWTLVHTFSGLANDMASKDIVLDQVLPARYLKLVATETYTNGAEEANKYFSGKLLSFYEDTTQTYLSPAEVTYSTTQPTNGTVTATLVLPEGCSAQETEYVFQDNGTYTFTYTDANAEQQTIQAQVTWIDRTAPTGTVTYSVQEWTSQAVIAQLDQLSEDVEFLDGSDGSYTFLGNGSYTFTIRDAAGNVAEYTAQVVWIDHTKPAEEDMVTVSSQGSSGTITLNIDPSRVEVLSVNGQAVDGPSVEVQENGTYTFRMRLRETGYEFEYTVTVDWLQSESGAVPPPVDGETGGGSEPEAGEDSQPDSGSGSTEGGQTDEGSGSIEGSQPGGGSGNQGGTDSGTGDSGGSHPDGGSQNGSDSETGGQNGSNSTTGGQENPGSTGGTSGNQSQGGGSQSGSISSGNSTGPVSGQGDQEEVSHPDTPVDESQGADQEAEQLAGEASLTPESGGDDLSQGILSAQPMIIIAALAIAACAAAGIVLCQRLGRKRR